MCMCIPSAGPTGMTLGWRVAGSDDAQWNVKRCNTEQGSTVSITLMSPILERAEHKRLPIGWTMCRDACPADPGHRTLTSKARTILASRRAKYWPRQLRGP